MRVHHLNCGTLCPVAGGHLLHPGGGGKMVCHCLLVESNQGLVLIDTGFGTEDISAPLTRMSRSFQMIVRPRLDVAETALAQVKKLGFDPRDVRHIVLTHLDVDHAGGLSDFPEARVHIYGIEHDAAMFPRTYLEKERYRTRQWAHGPDWLRHDVPDAGEKWFGFDCVRQMDGLPPEILMIPIVGHTRGHCGVAIEKEGGGWLLHCGDAYFAETEMSARPTAPITLMGFQRMMAVNDRARRDNQRRLAELAVSRAKDVRLFCAHDPAEFASLSS